MRKIIAVLFFGKMLVFDQQKEDSSAVGDTGGIESCAFEVELEDGSMIEMGNELNLSASSSLSSGLAVPGYMEILRVNMSAMHMDCDDLTVGDFDLELDLTDEAGFNWYVELDTVTAINLSTGMELGEATVFACDITETWCQGVFAEFIVGTGDYEGITVSSGETDVIAFYADMSGVSAINDDTLTVTLIGDSVDLSDNGVDFYATVQDDLVGPNFEF